MNTPVGKPKPKVKLVGMDGNAFAIMGRVSAGLRRTVPPHTEKEIDQFVNEAMAGEYDGVLRAAMKWSMEPDEDDYWDDEEVQDWNEQ